jgi:Amt family ammonium transporter
VITDVDGLFYGGGADQLGRQLVAAGATFAFSFVVTALIALALEKTVGFRVDEEHEMTGLDQELHAETAYDLTVTGGARTHSPGGTGTLLS